ncbi:hypothetical protein IX51_08770 [uncultured archaeon]|nr:hypothetical protein IX51_08770 [uncultured archaeon]
MNDFESARDEFKALKNMVYLNWAGLGPLPSSAKIAVEELLKNIYEWDNQYVSEAISSLQDGAKGQIAKLLNTSPDQIAITGTNTTQGIQTAFEAIRPKSGESIVTSDMQYVLTEAELQKWRDRGVDIKVVKNRDGVYDLNDFQRAVDKTTRAVFVDSVTWINGYKFDVPELSKIAHENNAFMITDSIQHLGQAKMDVEKSGADLVAGSAQKWLSDWLGLGFLYVRRKVIEELERPYYGYKNTEEPDGGWHTYFTLTDREQFPEFKFYSSDARKFEYGGSLYNMPGLTALEKTLKLINGIGMDRVQRRVLELKHELLEGLEALDFEVLEPYEEKHQSGITTFRMGVGRKKEMEVVEKLNSTGYAISYRAGGGLYGIRVSTHYVNNSDDIQSLLGALKSLRAKAGVKRN